MRTEDEPEPLRILAGPTASGKTALGVAVARAGQAEVLSMDSMLVYRGMDVGTAKPDAAERAGVAHHLIDLVDPHESFTVTEWLAAVGATLDGLRERGRRALFVGGTAFYLKALVSGLFEGPDVDPALRAELERRWQAEGAERLHAELARVDPPSAQRLHPHDRKRVVRALEVWHQSGRPLSDWQREWGWGGAGAALPRPHVLVALVVEPAELERRIRARTRAMLDAGWVVEVQAIAARGGFGPTARQALGYSEVLELAEGRLSREEAEDLVAVRTRRLARKQRTWLRQFPQRIEIAAPRPADPADMARAAKETLAALGW